MRRSELEHAIRAATEIIRQDTVFVIGSQSILGSFTEDQLPAEATVSEEIDIAPMNDDDAQSLANWMPRERGPKPLPHRMTELGCHPGVLPGTALGCRSAQANFSSYFSALVRLVASGAGCGLRACTVRRRWFKPHLLVDGAKVRHAGRPVLLLLVNPSPAMAGEAHTRLG